MYFPGAYNERPPLPLPYEQGALIGQTEDRGGGNAAALAAGIWGPTLLLAGGAFATGYYPVGLAVAAVAMVVHSVIDPRVAVIALIAIIPCDWMVSVIPQVTTLSKMLGVWALFVSLPRLLPKVAPNSWDPSAKWIIGMLSWAAIGLFWARYPQAVVGGGQSLILTWGLPVLICVQFKDRASIQTALILFVIACTISSGAYILVGNVHAAAESTTRLETQNLLGAEQEHGLNPNSIARNFGLAFLAAVYLIITLKGVARRALLVAGLMVIALAIVVLKGRAVYLALPAALVASVVLLKGGGVAKRIVLALVIVLIGGAVGFVMMKAGFLGKGIEERFNSIFEEGFHAGNRLDFWQAQLRVFLKTGLIGVGLSQTQYRSDTFFHVAHNDWISILTELGIVGFICLLSFHVVLARRMWRLHDVWARMFCMAVWIFIMIGAMTEDDYKNKHYTLAVGFILALVQFGESRVSLQAQHRQFGEPGYS